VEHPTGVWHIYGMETTGDMSTAEVAQVLDLLKLASGQPDAEIARRAGLARNTWRNKRTGKAELTLSEVLAVSAAFGVPVELFFMPSDQAKQWVHDRWDMLRNMRENEYTTYIDLTHFVHQGQGKLPLPGLAA
jgi:transcriptional regulator with XRE-family HTH domain